MIKRGSDYINKDGSKTVRWECKCDCGNPNIILVRGTQLRNGKAKSCGCLRIEKSKENGGKNKRKKNISCKEYNTYDLTGEYGIGYTSNDEEFYFDLEDYELIKNYCWHIDNGYVIARSLDLDNKTICMHRLVMGLKEHDNKRVDHIFHNTNDNRKKYMRIVTGSQNVMNSKMFSNNTSGYKGVYYDKSREKWGAKITINKKHIFLGRYNNIEDAIIARKKAEEKYFGEYNYEYYSEEDLNDQ